MSSDGFAANIQLFDERSRNGALASPIREARKLGLIGTASGANP
jgi:hypothetical protein